MHGKFFYETGLEAPRGVPDGTKQVFFCREFFEQILCPSFEGVGVMRERAGRRGSPSTFCRRNTAPEQITLPWMLELSPLMRTG